MQGPAETSADDASPAVDMKIPALRLELLKLVHRHDHPPEQVLERAKVLAAWVFDSGPKPGPIRATPPASTKGPRVKRGLAERT